MATRAESLIRQFCTARRTEIEQETKAARNRIPAYVHVKDMPAAARVQIRLLRKLQQRVTTIQERLVKQYGFSEYELQQSRSKLTNPASSDLHDAALARRASRTAILEKVQQTAYIAVMGRTPGEARIVIEELQKALRQI